ncbi:hypothetical protein VP1G_02268 [Cytospora mali]|uniref:Zn(2)-C6 fungal-type domain-containing protein n=1 Tax=Cytospora mali TaxID=578113 RepID=A0A194UTA2_CYTMA|nr:hypothetical protein VP1G_02268 [Valsa mali var. pyri (nom. inval.)]
MFIQRSVLIQEKLKMTLTAIRRAADNAPDYHELIDLRIVNSAYRWYHQAALRICGGLRIAKDRSAMMDDFLDAPKSTYACTSVDDLTLHLGGLRQQRVTDARAEHISATFEFNPTVIFNIPETENDAVDPQNLDPALGGTPGAAPAAAMNGSANPATREIRAHDTLINQPTDDPALQKLVAKHIVTSLGNVDGSSWIVRSVSRNTSGWTFTYLCKNSTQAWMRQNSKNAAKLRVGESSGKDGQDPVNLAFAKNSRMITVKLEHTPLHKTVAELAELFKPPPPLPRTEVGRRKDGESNKRRSQAVNGVGNGEDGARKKRKKKTTNPDGPDGPAADGEQTPKPKRPRISKARKPKGTEAQAQADVQQNSLLNLSPSEAARRKDEATKKLRDAGIDPDTLSTEQFDIFANQSPDLQTESLAMLVKYGAERLRIVHPNKDNASQPDASTPADGATPDGSTRKKKKSRKSGFNEDGTPKVKKTRGGCQNCRANKTKCSKAKPECQECIDAGLSCYYPPEQKRKSTGIKSAEVAEDESEEPAQALVQALASEPMPGPTVEQAAETAAEEEAQSATPRQTRSRNKAAPSTYEAPQQEGLASATALSQAALQKTHPSPTARTVSPFQNPTHATRAKSRQGQRSQSRQTASPFQHSSARPAAIDTPDIYNSSVATDSNSLPSYDQYSRYNTATTQPSQSNSRVSYEPYSQQTPNSSSTSYPIYDTYNSRSQASTSSSLANPATQSMPSSYTKAAASSSNNWSNPTSSRNNNPNGANRAAGSSSSAYNVPPSSAQQQPANVQSFNVRPPSTVSQSSRSSTKTPSSYAQQPRQPQQPPYNSYTSQAHNTSSQQPQTQTQTQPQPQPQPQDWYGFGSANNATSNYGSGSYSQNRSMNITGNTYSSINGQEDLYEMLRNNPRH